MSTEFEPGVGMTWTEDDTIRYGAVMAADNGVLEIVPVRPLRDGVKCYDDGGAIERRDRDNVRLKDAPPPFTILCIMSGRGQCFALAAAGDRIYMPSQLTDLYGMSVIDDGAKISDRDRSEILDHPWRDEKERYRRPVTALDRMKAAADLIDENQYGNDGQDGPDFQ